MLARIEEAEELADAEAAEDTERAETWSAVRADRERLVAAKIISQSDLNVDYLARKLAAGCEEVLQ